MSLTLAPTVPARDDMVVIQFNQMMGIGLRQAKEDDSFDLDEVFGELEQKTQIE